MKKKLFIACLLFCGLALNSYSQMVGVPKGRESSKSNNSNSQTAKWVAGADGLYGFGYYQNVFGSVFIGYKFTNQFHIATFLGYESDTEDFMIGLRAKVDILKTMITPFLEFKIGSTSENIWFIPTIGLGWKITDIHRIDFSFGALAQRYHGGEPAVGLGYSYNF